MKTNSSQVPKGPFNFLFLISKPYKGVAFIAFSAVLFATTIVSFSPYVYKRIVDSLGGVSGIGPESVWFWTLMYVATHLLSSLLWRTSGFSGLRWATGVRKTGREMLTNHIVGHSHSYFSNRFAGSLSSRLNQASEGVKSMVEGILWQWAEFFLQFGISLYLAFITNSQIGWVFVLWVAIMTPINVFLFKKKLVLGKAAVRSDTELTAHTVDMLTNISAVRDYARTDFELNRAYKFIEERRKAGAANWLFTEKAVTLNNVFEAIFSGGMILATVYFWESGLITAGDILLVITLVASMRKTISTIGKEFNSFADTLSLVKEGLSEVLNEHEIVDAPHAKNLEVKEGLIKFDNISFNYDTREIFRDLNLEIRPGERVGLIGRSGAGKSTLVKLLTRQHELSQGSILIDGQDIAKVTQESLREAIAGVPQEPLLFHRSLKENISYGNLKVGDEEIALAAERAQASQFIEVLPAKYETLVGERGIKLSGGEKQRVAIARAFLKDAKILLLDEATSALDSESEILIQGALQRLMQGKTVIAIAHRLSTLRAMDRLIVMDKGKIVEDGTHEELLNQGGIYAGLWAHQAGGFLQEE